MAPIRFGEVDMSKKVKVALGIVLALAAAVGIVFYVVSTKIDPEMIRKSAVKAIENNLNNVSASIEKVSYDLGFTVRLNVKGLDVRSSSDKKNLLSVEHARVEIPVFSILTNGGTVDVKIDRPKLVYTELPGGSSNWTQALPKPDGKSSKQTSEKTAAKEDSAGKKEVSLPGFIENSRIDLKITGLLVDYRPAGAKAAKAKVDKILLKNLNLKKTTAFEVVSSVSYGLDENKTISANAQLVGEIALKNVLETGAVDTNMMLNIENAKLSWLDLRLPPVKNVIRLKIKKGGGTTANLRTSAGNALSLETDIGTSQSMDRINVKKIAAKLSLGRMAEILGPKRRELVSAMDLANSSFHLDGSALIGLKNKSFNPQLSFKLDGPVGFSAAGRPVRVSLKGRYVGKDLTAKVKNELLSGVATLDVATRFNPLRLPQKIENYEPVKAQLLITNLKIEKPFIQELLYKNNQGGQEDPKNGGSADASSKKEAGLAKTEEPLTLPPFAADIEGKHIFIDKKEMNMAGTASGGGNSARLPSLKIVYGSGTAALSGSAGFEAGKTDARFSLDLKKMELAGLNAFLPPLISEVRGKFEGKVSGAATAGSEKLSYDVKADVRAVDGELKNLNLSSFLLPLIESVSLLKGKVGEDKMVVTDKFEAMELKARATENIIALNDFDFVGNNKSVLLEAQGKVSMSETGASRVKGDLTVEQISGAVENLTGSKEIPFLLEGKGFALMPRIKHTTDRLTERAARKELSARKEKAEESLKKEKKKLEKKLEKEIKDKAKDLLKGFKL